VEGPVFKPQYHQKIINSNWIKDLQNVRTKNHKTLSQKKTQKCIFYDLGFGNVFLATKQKGQEMKKIGKIDFAKLQTFVHQLTSKK
jgi:hypothetical protein